MSDEATCPSLLSYALLGPLYGGNPGFPLRGQLLPLVIMAPGTSSGTILPKCREPYTDRYAAGRTANNIATIGIAARPFGLLSPLFGRPFLVVRI